jgi:hypothetical protein
MSQLQKKAVFLLREGGKAGGICHTRPFNCVVIANRCSVEPLQHNATFHDGGVEINPVVVFGAHILEAKLLTRYRTARESVRHVLLYTCHMYTFPYHIPRCSRRIRLTSSTSLKTTQCGPNLDTFGQPACPVSLGYGCK